MFPPVRVRRLVVALLLAAALLPACAEKPVPPAGNGSSAPTAESSGASAAATPEPAQTSSPATEAVEETADAPTTVKYRMTADYRIVPIDEGNAEGKVVLLTFDDGPKNAETLGKLLQTLDKHGAKAIFFVNGYRVEAHPELLAAIEEAGQAIGNHAWDHVDLSKEKPEEIERQITEVQRIVRELTGKPPFFFRPPFAGANDRVRQVAKENGLLFMTWSNGSLDWEMGKLDAGKRPQAVIDNVLKQLHKGGNILMHELEWTADALDKLLTELEERGYGFVDPAEIDIDVRS